MKLVFPGGEHPQVLLGPGVNRVGSDPDATIVLDRPGVLPQHCELHVTDHGVMLQVPQGTTVSVNGRNVDGLISLRPGDSVSFDRIQARLATIEAAAPSRHHVGPLPAPANDDPGATAVRPVVPRFVLRGVSAEGFGRSHPLLGPTVVGRAPECNLRLDANGLSRQHARLVLAKGGVQVEDLGSTNGTFINGKRVQRGLAVAGDEIGFDQLRFRLTAPGKQEPKAVVTPMTTPDKSRARVSRWWWIVMVVAGSGAIGVAMLLR
ncbi:MAG: FHA domain-containing protein [Luteimonas sp.]